MPDSFRGMALVSVIIPVHNRDRLLIRAIESVRAQSFQDFEIIVVDDHSTIDIAAVIKDQPVRLLSCEGRGVSAARNTGIRAAQGEFIALLDSDDEWLPLKLEKQIAHFQAYPHCSLVHTDEIWVRNGARVQQLPKHKKFGGRIFDKCVDQCLIAPSTVMFRKILFDRIGMFDEDFVVCEDFDLWLRITAVEDVGFLPEPLTIKHGGHEDQLSRLYHSMDLYRVRALAKHIGNPALNSVEQAALLASLGEKSQILLKGFKKHGHLEKVAEIEKHLLRATNDIGNFCRPSAPILSHSETD